VLDYNVKDFIVNAKFAQSFGKALSHIPGTNSKTGKPNAIYLTMVANDLKDKEFNTIMTQLPFEAMRGIKIEKNSKLSHTSFKLLGSMLK